MDWRSFGPSPSEENDMLSAEPGRCIFNSLSHLNLWKQHLGAVPESAWQDRELETLVLADNDLTEVPAELGRLTPKPFCRT